MIYISKLFSPISTGTSAGDIDVGATVKINENGQQVEHIVVHQGLPSSMYDASCEGTWCLRKDIAENRQWNSNLDTDYSNSLVNAYLNGDWMNRYEPDVANAIKQVKIPFCVGNGSTTVNSGSSGLPCKSFLLSGKEVGFTIIDTTEPVGDGVKLDWFISGQDNSANQKRVANLNDEAEYWWNRSPVADSGVNRVSSTGSPGAWLASSKYGLRPCFILPYDFKFQEVS